MSSSRTLAPSDSHAAREAQPWNQSPPAVGRALADRRLTARAGLALLLANARYWPTIAPTVRAQLRRWERHARDIRDPALQTLALQKLHDERFNAQVAATLATLAPGRYRAQTVEAIVAFEVMYDYLDGLTEQPSRDPVRNGHQLYRAFTDALAQSGPGRDYYLHHPQSDDGGYLEALTGAAQAAIAQLPATSAIADVALASAARCAEAQAGIHAVAYTGTGRLEQWAQRAAADSGLQWREFLAGAAASVLAVHALIAAAADPRTTRAQAAAIDAYYVYVCALSTLLDSLVDRERDTDAGEAGYLRYYAEDQGLIARGLERVAQHAAAQARDLPHAAHHLMTLVGVVAYYTSAPTATDEFAAPLTASLQRQLQPLTAPTLAVMRTWRLAKRIRHRSGASAPAPYPAAETREPNARAGK